MLTDKRIAALILAAGYSSRMGSFKPLLPLEGLTVIEQAVRNFRLAGIEDIRVVVGYQAQQLRSVLAGKEVMMITNPSYAEGMYSSVISGLRTIQETEGFFLLPGDMPLVSSQSIRKLLKAYQETQGSVFYPNFCGKRGHPPLIIKDCYQRILAGEGLGGLRAVLGQFEESAIDVELADPAILLDMDTPEDYQKMLSFLRHKDIPTLAESMAILDKFQVSEKVVKHSRMVARVARELGMRLNKCGFSLHLELLLAASLLHDLAKGQPEHASEGARILSSLNYPLVASLVAQHTEIDLEENAPLDEASILYLSDKLVQEDQVIGLEERFKKPLSRYFNNPDILEVIKRRKEKALLIKGKIELVLDLPDLSNLF